MARKRRPLSPEDEDLWRRVAKTTTPLRPDVRQPLIQPPPAAVKKPPKPVKPAFAPAPFRLGSQASEAPRHDLAPSVAEQLDAVPLRMDKKTFARLKRGKSRPEARLDLHGMTLDQAQGALFGFIPSTRARGCRLVLVITGKGRNRDGGGPIPERMGVLRHQVPRWLNGPALAAMVQQVTPAHPRHGGSGALYVYLRR
ncbi:MAG: DNA mismatch repair protein MutS [Rhodobacteraceae bacterium]|nr:DNA mismatch repair protein MutS [Paracoccaceae bacterium]